MKSRRAPASIPLRRLRTEADAVRFIDAEGICLLFPVKKVPLSSLYFAVARREPITWDRYAELIWNWKDSLPAKRKAFYAKSIKARGTFISLKLLPSFLATKGSPTSPGDHEQFWAEGLISSDARILWETLEQEGPLPTLELRHAAQMDSLTGNKRFKRAMLELQGRLVVTHFGSAKETAAWPSSRFELTFRAFPSLVDLARKQSPEGARAVIATKYLERHPGAAPAAIARLFGWTHAECEAALRSKG